MLPNVNRCLFAEIDRGWPESSQIRPHISSTPAHVCQTPSEIGRQRAHPVELVGVWPNVVTTGPTSGFGNVGSVRLTPHTDGPVRTCPDIRHMRLTGISTTHQRGPSGATAAPLRRPSGVRLAPWCVLLLPLMSSSLLSLCVCVCVLSLPSCVLLLCSCEWCCCSYCVYVCLCLRVFLCLVVSYVLLIFMLLCRCFCCGCSQSLQQRDADTTTSLLNTVKQMLYIVLSLCPLFWCLLCVLCVSCFRRHS